jgi:hypothetical protein
MWGWKTTDQTDHTDHEERRHDGTDHPSDPFDPWLFFSLEPRKTRTIRKDLSHRHSVSSVLSVVPSDEKGLSSAKSAFEMKKPGECFSGLVTVER